MKIDINHLSKLARLKIEPEKTAKFEQDMQAIIDMVEHMPAMEEDFISVDKNNPMTLRKDEIKPSFRREEMLKNAPKAAAGCVIVPKTVE